MPEDSKKFDSGYAAVRAMREQDLDVPYSVVREFRADPKDQLGDAPQPSKRGAVEYSSSFRKAAQSARAATDNGRNPYAEAGFSVSPSGAVGALHKDVTFPGKTPQDKISYSPDDLAVLHTHPDSSSSKPSQVDTDAAKKIKKVVYVTSKDGLWATDPSGKSQQLFKSPTWYSDKDPE